MIALAADAGAAVRAADHALAAATATARAPAELAKRQLPELTAVDLVRR